MSLCLFYSRLYCASPGCICSTSVCALPGVLDFLATRSCIAPKCLSTRAFVMHLDVSVFMILCCTCACLTTRALCCTWPCLSTRACAALVRVCLITFCCTWSHVLPTRAQTCWCKVYIFFGFGSVCFETGMFVSIHETNQKIIFLFHETNRKRD
jgi:hypothetical protein